MSETVICHDTAACKLLVYEFMLNGSLVGFLHGENGNLLNWPTRFWVALDVVVALYYLHHACDLPDIHRDVKPSNILLNAEFGDKLSDVGVAKDVRAVENGPESMSAIADSCGHIASSIKIQFLDHPFPFLA